MSTHSEPYYTPNDPCPFCLIASRHPPIPSLLDLSTTKQAPEGPFLTDKGDAHIIISTPTVLAFMDIMPLTKGHVLVIPREHRANLAEMRPTEMMFVGAWLPVVARAVVRVTGWGDFNIVQNNGSSASQVVFHTHFHIVPRKPLRLSLSEAASMSYGSRKSDLDDQEGADMAREMRREIVNELRGLEKKRGKGEGVKREGVKDEREVVGGGEEIVLALL